jgi:geranylgeranyl reductase family protein
MGTGTRFDVMVVGAGPAGSVAATVLARGGARVALVDRSRFPRDKACGDLVGPRGLQVLHDLGLAPPPGLAVGDMVVVAPNGRRLRLPAVAGATYPGRALAVPRLAFDAALREAAQAAGAEILTGRARQACWADGRLDGFRCADREMRADSEVRADVVIGADGAASTVAEAAGLVEWWRVLWGFAVRWYVQQPVDLPVIAWWEPTPWRPLPGYGWLFPGPDGRANVGVGVGMQADRRGAAAAVRAADGFVAHLRRVGLLAPTANGRGQLTGRLGGWLKMGMVGTVPARGNVLLVGDAAGLVNPLQGEGIAQALASGVAAAEAVLAGPGRAAARYGGELVARHRRFLTLGAAAQRQLLSHPQVIAGVTRALTAPGVGRGVAGAWALLWNDLVEGAPPGAARAVARAALAVGTLAAAPGATRRWFDDLQRTAALGYRCPSSSVAGR